MRLILGAGFAELGWFAFDATAAFWPVWLRFVVGSVVLIGGPGAAATFWLTTERPLGARLVLAGSLGLAVAPLVAHLVGLVGLTAFVPWIAALLLGVAVAGWPAASTRVRPPRASRAAFAATTVIALSLAATTYTHRLAETPQQTTIYGEYDAFDLTYYAAIAAELSHTVPPESPFRAGRALVHSYYPHLAMAVVHRFADVPMLDLYFRFAWPLFLVLAGLTCFLWVEQLAGAIAALMASVLLVAGSNLSYLAAWFFRPSGWDDVLWSTNFLSPGAESLYFNNWTPALCVVFASLYALDAGLRTRRRGWLIVAAAGIALTLLAKPFATVLLLGALVMTAILPGSSARARRDLLVTAGLALAMALPYLVFIVGGRGDAQVSFGLALFPLPQLMFDRLEIWDPFLTWLGAWGVPEGWQPALGGALAFPVFFVGALGPLLVALPGLWRALRYPQPDPMWRMLAWSVVGAIVAPVIVASTPYHETMQIHQFAIYLLPAFVGRALVGLTRPWVRAGVIVAVFVVSWPSMGHFVYRKWTDTNRPFASVSADEAALASVLRRLDPDGTRVLHRDPSQPNLVMILGERRSVLSWSRYERNVTAERLLIEAFFGAGTTGDQARDTLAQFTPTHVIEYRGRDDIPEAVMPRLRLVFESREVRLWAVRPATGG